MSVEINRNPGVSVWTGIGLFDSTLLDGFLAFGSGSALSFSILLRIPVDISRKQAPRRTRKRLVHA